MQMAEAGLKQIPNGAGLGTLLRQLIELLDGDVEAIYREEGLNCRSRFTPVIRHLERHGPSSIRHIAEQSRLTHSATSQTVSEMLKAGLVKSTRGEDGRERIISFTTAAEELLPRLHRLWSAIWTAADQLSQDIEAPLASLLERAICEVSEHPFRDRIRSNLEMPATAIPNDRKELSLPHW